MLTNDKKALCSRCFKPVKQHENFCEDCRGKLNNTTHTAALKEGTVLLGKYAVGKLLGKGGFGMTYLCYDLVNDKPVAIKEFFPESLAYRTAGQASISTQSAEKLQQFTVSAKKFYEEASLVSRFNGNPNVISVHEFFYENNTAYFVMEYLDGFDFKHYINQKGKKIPESEAVYVTDKVLDALLIVHSMGVLHRDISPDNIYMCSDGNVKLIDFGAARQVVGEESKSLSVILKQGFAPLEQYQKRGNQGPWTDIYALGATLYYALTGIVIDDAMSRLDDPSLKLDGISPALAQVLTKMLAVRVEDRYKSVVELKADMALLQLPMTEPSIKIDKERHSFCILCGKIMPYGIELCHDCEAKENEITVDDIPPFVDIPGGQNPPQKPVKKPKKWLLPTLIAAAGIVAVVLVVLIIKALAPGNGGGDTPAGPDNPIDPNNPVTPAINVETKQGKCGDNLTWELNGSGILTISGYGDMYDYDWPKDAKYSTAPWGEYSERVIGVIFEEGITHIGNYAFLYCNHKTVNLPSTVKSVGDFAFAGCFKLKNVTLNDALETIGFSAFYRDEGVTTVTIPSGVIYVDEDAFSGWIEGQTIIVNVPVNVIEEYWNEEWAAESTANIIYAEIVKSGKCGDNLEWTLTSDGTLTISGNGKMYNYAIVDDQLTMPWADYRSDIEKVVVEEGVTEIGDYAFTYFDIVTDIQLPSTVKSLGKFSIAGCQRLETIKLPMKLEFIGGAAFAKNSKMKSIEIPSTVTLVGDWAFHSWTGEQTIIVNETKAYVNENWNAAWCEECSANIRYADSTGNETISSGYCGDSMEWKFTSDGTLTISGYGDMYDYDFDDDSNLTCPWFVYAYEIEKIVVNEGVEYIGALAFACSNVAEIQLPSTVWGLGDFSLAMCYGLEKVVLPAEILGIGAGVFWKDTNIKNISIPETVILVGSKAFNGWTDAQTIFVNATEAYTDENWDPEWDVECNANIKYYEEKTTAHTHTWGEVQYEPHHPHNGYHVCTSCTASEYVGYTTTLSSCTTCNPPASYSNIVASGKCGDNITWTLDDMETLTLTGTGATYDYYVNDKNMAPWYDYADSIKHIVVGEGITVVGRDTFYRCKKAVSVSLPNSLITIGYRAFDECESLQSINIPSSVTKIDFCAFYAIKTLSSITIPASVEYVGPYAFFAFEENQTIYIEASKDYVDANWDKEWNDKCNAKIIYGA